MIAAILAHQGGWDEVLLFAVPAIGAVLLVRWAEKRARRKREEDGGEPGVSMAPPESRKDDE